MSHFWAQLTTNVTSAFAQVGRFYKAGRFHGPIAVTARMLWCKWEQDCILRARLHCRFKVGSQWNLTCTAVQALASINTFLGRHCAEDHRAHSRIHLVCLA